MLQTLEQCKAFDQSGTLSSCITFLLLASSELARHGSTQERTFLKYTFAVSSLKHWEKRVISGVRKPNISFDSVLQKPNHPKIWHPSRRFSDRNCVQFAIQIKSDKINFKHIQCADKECFKTRPKQSLACRMQLITYLSLLWVTLVTSKSRQPSLQNENYNIRTKPCLFKPDRTKLIPNQIWVVFFKNLTDTKPNYSTHPYK